jgi:hypothetical protein
MAINVPTFETTKTALERVSEEVLHQVIQSPHGMFFHLKETNPDHVLVAGKRANQIGTVLYGFEHLGRDVNTDELAAQLGLDPRQVTNAVPKINAIISAVFGMKIERVKSRDGQFTGKLRITNQDDALQASEAYCKKLKKIHTEYVQTLRSYRNNGGDIRGLLAQTENGDALLDLVREVAPALPQAV